MPAFGAMGSSAACRGGAAPAVQRAEHGWVGAAERAGVPMRGCGRSGSSRPRQQLGGTAAVQHCAAGSRAVNARAGWLKGTAAAEPLQARWPCRARCAHLDDQQRHSHVWHAQAAAAAHAVGVDCGTGTGGRAVPAGSRPAGRERQGSWRRVPRAPRGGRACLRAATRARASPDRPTKGPAHPPARPPEGQPNETRVMASSNSRIVLAWSARSAR